jgi:hypothetical protein
VKCNNKFLLLFGKHQATGMFESSRIYLRPSDLSKEDNDRLENAVKKNCNDDRVSYEIYYSEIYGGRAVVTFFRRDADRDQILSASGGLLPEVRRCTLHHWLATLSPEVKTRLSAHVAQQRSFFRPIDPSEEHVDFSPNDFKRINYKKI